MADTGVVTKQLEIAGYGDIRFEQIDAQVFVGMFAGQVAALAALGFPIRQAAPRQGYRAFAGLLSISAEVTDPAKLDACYDFLNWWHSGYGGAVLLRQGYYTGVQATSRRFMAPGEYGYWMEGEPGSTPRTEGRTATPPSGRGGCGTAGHSRHGPAGSRAGTRSGLRTSTCSSAGRSSSPASSPP